MIMPAKADGKCNLLIFSHHQSTRLIKIVPDDGTGLWIRGSKKVIIIPFHPGKMNVCTRDVQHQIFLPIKYHVKAKLVLLIPSSSSSSSCLDINKQTWITVPCLGTVINGLSKGCLSRPGSTCFLHFFTSPLHNLTYSARWFDLQRLTRFIVWPQYFSPTTYITNNVVAVIRAEKAPHMTLFVICHPQHASHPLTWRS